VKVKYKVFSSRLDTPDKIVVKDASPRDWEVVDYAATHLRSPVANYFGSAVARSCDGTAEVTFFKE